MEKTGRLVGILLLVTVLYAFITPAMAEVCNNRNYHAHLSGEGTNEQGQAIFQLTKDYSALDYKLVVSNIQGVREVIIELRVGDHEDVVVDIVGEGYICIGGNCKNPIAEGTITSDDLIGPLEGEDFSSFVSMMNAGLLWIRVRFDGYNISGRIDGDCRPMPSILLKKYTNGADANTPPGPYVLSGSTVEWTYNVTNTGNVALANLVVTDDRIVTIVCGKNWLAPGETITCNATGIATAGQYSNIGTATGYTGFGAVSDTDPSHYFGVDLSLLMEKSVSNESASGPWYDADTAEEALQLYRGDAIWWNLTVVNTGNVQISLQLNDTFDGIERELCPYPSSLAPGTNFTCIVNDTASVGLHENRLTATAVFGDLETVAHDSAFYNASIPPYALLTLSKTVVNDNGGTAKQWDFRVNITNLTTGFVFDASWSETYRLAPGNYKVQEETVSGYAASAWGGDCDSDGSITLAAGDVKTCSITNDDIAPTITVRKYVNKTLGGSKEPKDFNITVSANNASPSNFTGSKGGIAVTLDAGWFEIGEEFVPGYSASFEGICSGTIALGERFECNITNTYVPGTTLTLVKTVINDNGGEKVADNFTARITNESGFNLEAEWFRAYELVPGTYRVMEDPVPDYIASSWSGNCSAGGTVTIGENEHAICYITNDDIPATLILHKIVVNDNGGTATTEDFQAYINRTPVNWSERITLSAGCYQLSESAKDDYNASKYIASSWSGDCTPEGLICLGLNETKTCSITNDDALIAILLEKQVSVDDGMTWQDADGAPGPYVQKDTTVRWRFNVTNTGIKPLQNVSITDERVTNLDCPADIVLHPNESIVCNASENAAAGQQVNSATAMGRHGKIEVNFTDSAHYFGVDASLKLEKFTNGVHWNTPPGYDIEVGSMVTWRYNVTNTGNVNLTSLNVTDDREGIICEFNDVLQPGDTMVCENSSTAMHGQYVNNATAYGIFEPLNLVVVSNTDRGYYNGTFPQVKLPAVYACKYDTHDNPMNGWQMNLLGEDGSRSNCTTYPSGCCIISLEKPGNYTLFESMQEGWEKVEPAEAAYRFFAENGVMYEFNFTNRAVEAPNATITACKKNASGVPQAGWTMYLAPEDGDQIWSHMTDETGCTIFTVNRSGNYTLSEEMQPGWQPLDEYPVITIEVEVSGDGSKYAHTFNNARIEDGTGYATITACKNDIYSNPLPQWVITLSNVTDTWRQATNISGCTVFSVPYTGMYTLSEELQYGWINVSPTSHELNVDSLDAYGPYTFTNRWSITPEPTPTITPEPTPTITPEPTPTITPEPTPTITPEPTPTITPEPTPTITPEPTTTPTQPSPSRGGGVSYYYQPTTTVDCDYYEKGELPVTHEGLIRRNVTICALDGVGQLSFGQGSYAFDAGGAPLQEASIIVLTSALSAGEGFVHTGYGYDLQPHGAILKGPVELRMLMKPRQWDALEGRSLALVQFLESENAWTKLETLIASEDRRVSTGLSTLGITGLFEMVPVSPAEEPPVVEQPGEAPSPGIMGYLPWILLLILLAIIYALWRSRREEELPAPQAPPAPGGMPAGGRAPLPAAEAAYASIIEVLNDIDVQLNELAVAMSRAGAVFSPEEADRIAGKFFYTAQVAEEKIKDPQIRQHLTAQQIDKLQVQLAQAVNKMIELSKGSEPLRLAVEARITASV